ncbi:HoxN/HupN/NixA family nickel/cobalt transporter [Actinomyces haliotis]|uniref:HoxN/HupN/NixA family nickel/cobalt transporter n=1 Tax=Actinomyces haliotis TaxID=1280843 RepID=UPI00188E556B|nr:nickel transporter [Actinomyces haliotis]
MRRPAHLPTVIVVTTIHVLAVTFLAVGHAAGAIPVALAGFAYTRGLLHALDADHLCMIDGSTRKLLGEHRDANGVGLAFSLGHSTVVLVAGLAVALGASWIRTALDPDSTAAAVLGLTGAVVSSLYLLAVAAANVPNLTHRHHELDGPRGPWARLLTRPLRHVRHAGHIYLFGVLFGLGFDTASTISLLMVTALATMSGASPLVLMALPLSFTAAMTLGDSVNANLMLHVYTTATRAARARFNTVVTAVSISCAVLVATGTALEVYGEATGRAVAELDTAPVGWGLVVMAVACTAGIAVWRRRHPEGHDDVPTAPAGPVTRAA